MEFGLVCWAGCRRRLWALAAPMGSAKESERKQTNQTEWRSHLIYGFVIEWEWMNKFNKSIDVGRLGAQRAGSGEKKTWNLFWNENKLKCLNGAGAEANNSINSQFLQLLLHQSTNQLKIDEVDWMDCWRNGIDEFVWWSRVALSFNQLHYLFHSHCTNNLLIKKR